MKKSKPLYTVIKKSCITGNAVWIYRGPSKWTAYMAYRRACGKEIERVANRAGVEERRKANIMKLLNSVMANIPITGELSMERKAAARMLRQMAEKKDDDRAFYDHIIEEKRRKENERRLRRESNAANQQEPRL